MSCIENSVDDIVLEKGIQQAFDELHSFMFAKVYTNPACKSEEKKAVDMIQRLYFHFAKKPENLPPQFHGIAEREGLAVAACDFIAGMTDRYAVHTFEELFVPRSWVVMKGD
jgi:dGTPase